MQWLNWIDGFIRRDIPAIGTVLLLSAFVWGPPGASASPILGTAESFAVLGNTEVTNTGMTYLNGDYGVSPGTSLGVAGVTLTGTTYTGTDAAAVQAQTDLTAAVAALALYSVTQDLSGTDLGTASPLNPGVYSFSSSAALTGTLTLDAMNDPNALFIFQIGSTLTTATDSVVTVINGSSNTGVYWVVGSSATLGTGTRFAGNILAYTSITLNTSATICGRALAQNGAVTMDTNIVSGNCTVGGVYDTGVVDFGSLAFSSDPTSAVPEPGGIALLGIGLFAMAGLFGKRSELARAV